MRQTTCEQIMETETPLDVLSRAASLVDTNEVSENSSSRSNKSISIQDNEVSSLKLVLPIKALKQRRKKRRDQDYFYTRLRAKRTAGTQTSVSLITETNAQDKIDLSSSPNKDVYEYDDSYDEQDSDTPLDMTIRNRKATNAACKETDSPDVETLKKCGVSTESSARSSLQQRPSVITCASTLQQTGLRTVKYSCSNNYGKNTTSETRHGHRREVLSGMCDPVIDEHFRRSLGKDYPEFFSNLPKSSTVSVCGLSVDDHFSKALGDTWLQLKEKSYSSNSSATTRPTELSQTSTSPLLQQC